MSINFIGAVWDSGLYDGPRLLMMLALADHADNDGWCFPHYDTLALKIRRNVKTVYRILSDLESDGAIKRHDNRIGICEPHILAEVMRRAESRHVQQAGEPPEPVPVSDGEPVANGTESDPHVLTSETESGHTEVALLTSETQILNSENPILTSETQILNSETLFFIDPSINRQVNRHEPATAAAAEPPTVAVAAALADADPVSAILRWINFSDRLDHTERAMLDPPTLLAWAYWIHLEQAKPTRPKNAVALARSQWRKGLQPSGDLLALARIWLSLDDDARRAVLDGCRFGTQWVHTQWAHTANLAADMLETFENFPITAARSVYRATDGVFGPPSLMPVRDSTRAVVAEVRARPVDRPVPRRADATDIWDKVLDELKNQMTRDTFSRLLRGTTASVTGSDLVVHVTDEAAAQWLQARLHAVIQRSVQYVIGRPMTIRYEVTRPEFVS